VKHSGARTCVVRLGPTWMEIEDDGGRRPAAWAEPGSGLGLAGLSERLRAVGGRLNTTRVRSGGFLLRAEAP